LSDDYPDSDIVLMHISHSLDFWLLNHPDALTGRVTLGRDNDTLKITRKS
jgi:phosphoribosyl 1,2-cyclic phosphate phosphodiesterase